MTGIASRTSAIAGEVSAANGLRVIAMEMNEVAQKFKL